ncbi:MAG: cation:proton antiporter [Candidatus Bipolaricaulia bacterium]
MHGTEHLLEIFFLLAAAQLAGRLFQRLGQPAVIGQLLAGILVGPSLLGLVHEGEIMGFLAELGAVVLLFLVGLEVRLNDIVSVGKEAVAVAILGVALPFGAGYAYGLFIGFEQLPALFLGTALVATSVGITAAVLQEIGVLSRTYSRIILGAAVIDDVLGLIVLAVVSGIAQTGSVEPGSIAQLSLLSLAFVGGAMLLVPVVRRIPLDKLPFGGPFSVALTLAMGLSGLATAIGLAPIVGAFFAGMLLAEVQEEYQLAGPTHALELFLTPIFFAMIGVRLELGSLMEPTTLAVGGVASAIAIVCKLVGGMGALTQGGRQAVVVGVGMVPRGEVGLIVAAIGLSAGAVDQREYALVLLVVLVTTLVVPFALRPLINWAEAPEALDATDAGAAAQRPDSTADQ